MKVEKKSFLVYLDYKQHFELLTDDEKGKLLMAMFDFAETGQVPIFDGALKMAFSFVSSQMIRDMAKYEEKCQKNRMNGALGGRPKKQTESEKTERFSEKPQKPDTDKDTDKDMYINVPEGLRDTFEEFAQMRKLIKKPITSKNTVTRLLNKLNSLTQDQKTQVLILQQSIDNCWRSVFPLQNYITEIPVQTEEKIYI